VNPSHLYVHVPFCARRCAYCDFAVTALRDPPAAAWLDSVEAELSALAEEEGWATPLALRTLYVGGGTPSLLPAESMAELRERLSRLAVLEAGGEWTVEANPESLSVEKALAWAAAGVNRVSLGAQTFDAGALRWMGRLHGADGPAHAVKALRRAGLGNYSIDLIFGLPSRLGRDWGADLERVLALEPSHVSLYGLTAEPATPLGGWVQSGRERLAGDERYEAEYLLAAERLAAAGFEHYEVSNFARPGHESRHNLAYWSGTAYVGLGPGAHSFLPPRRLWNVRDWAAYRQRVVSGEPAREGGEVVEGASASLEGIWLGLRTREGVAWDALEEAQASRIERWLAQGWAERRAGGFRLTARGWLLLDRLALELDGAAAGGA
jgi:oxygen-independent coproporphyrinogen III oxidase